MAADPSSRTFIVNKTITLKEALPIADILTARYLVPGEFLAFFKTKLSPEAVLKRVVERAEKQIVDSFRLEEWYLLRGGERKRPLAPKTRRSLQGQGWTGRPSPSGRSLGSPWPRRPRSRSRPRLGPPWEKAEAGRPPIYGSGEAGGGAPR